MKRITFLLLLVVVAVIIGAANADRGLPIPQVSVSTTVVPAGDVAKAGVDKSADGLREVAPAVKREADDVDDAVSTAPSKP